MSEVEVRVDDGVAVVSLNAPERRNALTVAMAGELAGVADRLDADLSVRAVVIRGEGRAFCAGAQLDALTRAGSDPSSDASVRAVEDLYQAFVRVGAIRAPTIAAVHGAAVGAGFNLALATDLRVVDRDARLFAGFDRLGLHPGGGHFVLLARTAGREAAAAIGLFGAQIDGVRAVELGLAWEATDTAAVTDRAVDLARCASADPELARRTTASFRRETGPPMLAWDVGVEVERAPQMWSLRRAGVEDKP